MNILTVSLPTANRSDVYNEYYNKYGVDSVMGPTHYCDFIKWSVRVSYVAKSKTFWTV